MYWLMSTLPSVTHSVESHGERSEHVDQKDTQLECVSNMAGLEWRSFSLSLSLPPRAKLPTEVEGPYRPSHRYPSRVL